jgi:NitT/TauT family transport system permease protein
LPETATTAAGPAARLPRLPRQPGGGAVTVAPALPSRLAQGSRRAFLSVIGLAVVAVAWQVLPSEHIVDPTFVSPLSEVLSTWWHLLLDGTLWANASVSIERAGVGFGIAVVVGVPLGLAIGWHRLVAEVASPVLELFRNTAPLALLPVFTLILGIGQTSKFLFVAYACLWPILLNTISAIQTVDPLLIKSARSLGFGQLRVFQKVVLPASVPQIFTGVRLAGTFSLLVLIAAELVGANSGLGFMITKAQSDFDIPTMYAAIITVTLLGLGLSFVLLRIERRLSAWRASA